jgi:hypothetical protein
MGIYYLCSKKCRKLKVNFDFDCFEEYVDEEQDYIIFSEIVLEKET